MTSVKDLQSVRDKLYTIRAMTLSADHERSMGRDDSIWLAGAEVVLREALKEVRGYIRKSIDSPAERP